MTRRLLILSVFLIPLQAGAQTGNSAGPEKWESSISAFETRDAASPPPTEALLFVGSSSIRMWDLKRSWPDKSTINNGFGGSTLADSIHHFDRLFTPYSPGAIVLYAGDNDIKKGLNAPEVARDFETLASLIQSAFPEVPVIYIAIKPSIARRELWPEMKQANDLIAALCNEQKYWFFADISAPMLKDGKEVPPAKWFIKDGLHLSAFGYQKWTSVVNGILEKAMPGE
ncbi:MAG: GDSL-type esterase/lipase family protein [Verrucomicrobiales bacterium]|nr:GDSL-type esterase/lipase family protein [Verrucomicrobiales bacterium]